MTSLFLLKTDFIISFDWMPATMTMDATKDGLARDRHSGQLFLDVDAVSFRLLVGLQRGTLPIEDTLSALSTAELLLLSSTADYLLCLDIRERVEYTLHSRKNCHDHERRPLHSTTSIANGKGDVDNESSNKHVCTCCIPFRGAKKHWWI